jgi:RNA polymerase sigma factor (sigma-70 family)
MTPSSTHEKLARQAVDGDRDALDRLVRDLQGDVYGLSLRMLWNREDAEDATQEILVRVVTRLAQFNFQSKLSTWVYRIAVNYILDVKKSPMERMQLTFQAFGEDLADGLSADGPADAERSMLIEEVKIGCTFGMLQCLDRAHRLAYVLGEILDLPGPEAAEALEITPELFRKRLQHARVAIETFTRAHCGLASNSANCACHRRVPAALRLGRVRPDALDFAEQPSSYQETRELVRRAEQARGRFRSIARVTRECPQSFRTPHREVVRVAARSIIAAPLNRARRQTAAVAMFVDSGSTKVPFFVAFAITSWLSAAIRPASSPRCASFMDLPFSLMPITAIAFSRANRAPSAN